MLPEETPDEDAWARAFDVGGRTVLEALIRRINRRIQRGATDREYIAILMGAITEVAVNLRIALANDPEAAERVVLAYVRAAMRQEKGPIAEDGSHLGGW